MLINQNHVTTIPMTPGSTRRLATTSMIAMATANMTVTGTVTMATNMILMCMRLGMNLDNLQI